MSASLDYQAGGDEAGYTGSYVDSGTAWGATSSDLAEWNRMQTYTPAPAGSEGNAWWQNLVSFGVSRAIDNTLPGYSAGVQGNVAPGSFAGQNGQTYYQAGSLNAAPGLAGVVASVQRMNPLVLVGLAVVAYLALKK
jgi:hypothetical protein